MAVAGYKSVVNLGAAASTSMTAEPMSNVSGDIYRVTSVTRRLLDPAQTPVVKDGGVTVSSALYTVDYLAGKVTFSGYTVLGAITIDAYYFVFTQVAELKSFELTVNNNLIDITNYSTTGVKSYLQGLRDAVITVSGTWYPWTDITTETTYGVTAYLAETTPRAWLFYFTDGSTYFGAAIWGRVKEYKQSAAVDGATQLSATIEAAAQLGKSVSFDTWT